MFEDQFVSIKKTIQKYEIPRFNSFYKNVSQIIWKNVSNLFVSIVRFHNIMIKGFTFGHFITKQLILKQKFDQ